MDKKKLKVMSLFSGIGAFEKALTNLDIPYELINFCEIDKYAIESYSNIHSELKEKNLGDISKVDTSSVKDFDLLVGGSPCFPKGTLVLTERGYKNIEDIKVGDKVLTHKNRYMPVDKVGHNLDKEIYELKAMGTLPILATPNHPFLVVTRTKKYKNENGEKSYYYEFSEPYKKRLDELEKDKDFLCSPILKTEENPYNLDEETCWLLGRYVADGCCGKMYKSEAIIVTVGKNKEKEFEKHLLTYKYYKYKTKTNTFSYTIVDHKINDFIRKNDFGSIALNKNIPNLILNLPQKLLASFIEGYFAGDGCYIKKSNVYQATTISKKLANTLQLAIQKLYNVGCRIYFDKRPSKYIIEGRQVNQHDTYIIRFTKEITKQKKYYIDNNMILYPIKSVENKNYKDTVYNIEVQKDHSYTIPSVYVGNCQDFSISGKTKGAIWHCDDCGYEYNPLTVNYNERNLCPHCHSKNITKTRSSLIVEYLRFLREKKPKYFIYENVKNLTGKMFKESFNMFLNELKEYGYNVNYKVLNSKNFDIPQNRERVFVVGIRNDINKKFDFPKGNNNYVKIKDILQDKVDEKYYIKSEIADKLIREYLKRKEKELNEKLQKENTEIIKTNINFPVKVRKYKVDIKSLQKLLNENKKKKNLSNKDIADFLKIEKTTVDHWFRTDLSFSIPDENLWDKLKEILEIKTDIFDKSIKTFEIKEGLYDKSNRCYLENGLSPTLTTSGQDKIITNESNEIENIGLLDIKGIEQVRRVYNEKGLSPTLNTCQGGNTQVKILCEQRSDEGLRDFKNGICGTLRTKDSGGDKRILETPICVASRGRNKENPSSRTVGLPTEQRLEENKQGISNTLTTFTKDNYILESCILKYTRNDYGKEIRKDYEKGIKKEQIKNMRFLEPRKDSLSNTLTTVQKDNYVLETNFIKKENSEIEQKWLIKQYKKFISEKGYIPKYFNPYNCTEIKIAPTLTTNCGSKSNSSTVLITEKEKLGEITIIGNYMPSGHEASRVVSNEGIAPTVKENHGTVTATIVKVGQISTKNSQAGIVYDNNGLFSTLCAGTHGYAMGNIYENYRIRKLTPRECFRLMGFSDIDYDKARYYTKEEEDQIKKSNKKYKIEKDLSGTERIIKMSDSQLYKQAGNSIVVNVLMAIFENLFK